MEDAECERLGCEHARFGMSLSKLGDVNNDGYQGECILSSFGLGILLSLLRQAILSEVLVSFTGIVCSCM